jgi:hypothetical protein
MRKMNGRIPGWLHKVSEEDIEILLRSEKGIIREFARWLSEPNVVEALQSEITRLAQENLRLRTIMMTAADEIDDHWESHCDIDGFGPRSLVRHLRDGSGYYPGAIERIKGGSDELDD